MILYFTALEREVTKAGKSCKESYFLLFLSLKLALLNLLGPNLAYLWVVKRSIEQFERESEEESQSDPLRLAIGEQRVFGGGRVACSCDCPAPHAKRFGGTVNAVALAALSQPGVA